ncbi:hydroxyacid dehydrogenase [Sesbania bispinosa]|nr:hydroxyacid dehydrogenase [Sesbania bispinosa]
MVQSEPSDLDASSPLQSQPLRYETRGRPLRGVSKVPAGPHASGLSDLGAPSQSLIHEARGRPLGRVFKAPAVPHSFNAQRDLDRCQKAQSVCPLYLHPRLLLSHWILPLFPKRNPNH